MNEGKMIFTQNLLKASPILLALYNYLKILKVTKLMALPYVISHVYPQTSAWAENA